MDGGWTVMRNGEGDDACNYVCSYVGEREKGILREFRQKSN